MSFQTLLNGISRWSELRSYLQCWYNYSYESPELKECFRFLELTSRSFSTLIKMLHPEVRIPVALFYVILRGMDTIEDDMTIIFEEKESLLLTFHEVLDDENWTYDGNGPNEKDRELLVKFNVVTKEFKKIKPNYQLFIKDITMRMGKGMAERAKDAVHNQLYIQTIKEYKIYCHYVAGLVGEGLTNLFVEAKLADPLLLKRPDFIESMGQFLQQTNIIRDIREDHDSKRYFWPKDVWSKYVKQLPDLFLPENKEKALQCQSEMIYIALQHVERCLSYIAGIQENSVFQFVTIPQTMAIATLELCFQNYTMFERNIKISRIETSLLIMRSSQNFQHACEVFREYAQKIQRKSQPQDLNHANITTVCRQIENFIDSTLSNQTKCMLSIKQEGKLEDMRKRKEKYNAKWLMIYIFVAVVLTLLFTSGILIR